MSLLTIDMINTKQGVAMKPIFVITAGTRGYRYDNLPCHSDEKVSFMMIQWWQSWHHDDSWFWVIIKHRQSWHHDDSWFWVIIKHRQSWHHDDSWFWVIIKHRQSWHYDDSWFWVIIKHSFHKVKTFLWHLILLTFAKQFSHSESWTKWHIFCRQHFEKHFLERKFLLFESYFAEFCSYGPNWQYISEFDQVMA